MKKGLLFVAVISAFSFASCKKDRTCTCTTVESGTGAGPTSTDITTYNESKKHDARLMCMSSTWTSQAGTTYTNTCTLK